MRIDPENFTQRGVIDKLHDTQAAFFRLGRTPGTIGWVQIENSSSKNPNSSKVTQVMQIHIDTLKKLLAAMDISGNPSVS